MLKYLGLVIVTWSHKLGQLTENGIHVDKLGVFGKAVVHSRRNAGDA